MINAQDVLNTVAQQRNEAMDKVAMLAAELASAHRRIVELEKEKEIKE